MDLLRCLNARRLMTILGWTLISMSELTLMAEEGYSQAKDMSAYESYHVDGNRLLLTSEWIRKGLEQSSYGDYARSMTVVGDVIYLTDASVAGGLSLWRYDVKTGERLRNLDISYPEHISVPNGSINHVGCDADGTIYVVAEVVNGEINPIVNIDVIDSKDGNVTSRISLDLASILVRYESGIAGARKSIYLSFPEIYGSISSGNYMVVLPEVYGFDEDGLGIYEPQSRVWRINFIEGEIDSKTTKCSTLLYPRNEYDYPYKKISADENLRVCQLTEKWMLIDDNVNLPGNIYGNGYDVHARSWLRKGAGSEIDPRACGIDYFEYNGQNYLLYGASVSNGVRFGIGHWANFDLTNNMATFDGEDVEQMWEFPGIDGGMGPFRGETPVTLCKAIVCDDDVKIYIYSSGNGLACYSMGVQSINGCESIIDSGTDRLWNYSDNVLRLGVESPIEVFSIDGRRVCVRANESLHDLNDIRRGVYIVKTDCCALRIWVD